MTGPPCDEVMSRQELHFPERAPIDAYGNGGFRFAEARHDGSLLILPSGMYSWAPADMAAVRRASFARAFAEAGMIDFLLFGTGAIRSSPAKTLEQAFAKAGIGLEVMDTGAACRTYNVLLGEGRAFAVALIAVE